MSLSFRLSVALVVTLTISFAGCGQKNCCENASPENPTNESSVDAQPGDVQDEGTPEVDDSPLKVDDPATPEGVVNEFFKTFFSGDDDGAFALLTTRAQIAKRDNFLAQESDTVRWRITKKMKPICGRVLVVVDVEDYTDSGSIQMDELTFVLTNDNYAWRIAGFSVGDLAINFEDAIHEIFVQEEDESFTPPLKTARVVDSHSIIR